MKRNGLILLGGLLLAVVVCAGVYQAGLAKQVPPTEGKPPELAWLQREFKLSDAEFARVAALHAAYQPRCRENCRQVDEVRAHLKKLLAAGAGVTPELEAALNEEGRLRAHCQAQMLQHFYEVSRAMPPEQGKRYLEWVQEQTLTPPTAGMCPAPASVMRHGN